MQAVKRPYAIAAAALAATSLVAATPQISRLAERPIRSMDTRLVDSSIFNIPFNLFQDIANAPYNEIQALNTLADSSLHRELVCGERDEPVGSGPRRPVAFHVSYRLLVPLPACPGWDSPKPTSPPASASSCGGWWRPSFR